MLTEKEVYDLMEECFKRLFRLEELLEIEEATVRAKEDKVLRGKEAKEEMEHLRYLNSMSIIAYCNVLKLDYDTVFKIYKNKQ